MFITRRSLPSETRNIYVDKILAELCLFDVQEDDRCWKCSRMNSKLHPSKERLYSEYLWNDVSDYIMASWLQEGWIWDDTSDQSSVSDYIITLHQRCIIILNFILELSSSLFQPNIFPTHINLCLVHVRHIWALQFADVIMRNGLFSLCLVLIDVNGSLRCRWWWVQGRWCVRRLPPYSVLFLSSLIRNHTKLSNEHFLLFTFKNEILCNGCCNFIKMKFGKFFLNSVLCIYVDDIEV